MNSFAIFRLPHERQGTLMLQTTGEPLQLRHPDELRHRQGFVMAPFMATSLPLLLIQPDTVTTFSSAEELLRLMDGISPLQPSPEGGGHSAGVLCEESLPHRREAGGNRASYAADFARFHHELQAGTYQKLVLSRCAEEPNTGDATPVELFLRACRLYPRLFIALVSTPQAGTWLTATPEILLEGDHQQWRTIALAGTMQLSGDDLNGEGEQIHWSVKNIQEQRYVASYVADCLKRLGIDYLETGPQTVRAAQLVHLRSDFTFVLDQHVQLCDLLAALHPTPAVCGLPKDEALRFIIGQEHSPRRYYSGYMGPLSPSATHLYVSLRCMQIEPSRYLLYAGGGILKDSSEPEEWQETESKLQTMRSLLTT